MNFNNPRLFRTHIIPIIEGEIHKRRIRNNMETWNLILVFPTDMAIYVYIESKNTTLAWILTAHRLKFKNHWYQSDNVQTRQDK